MIQSSGRGRRDPRSSADFARGPDIADGDAMRAMRSYGEFRIDCDSAQRGAPLAFLFALLSTTACSAIESVAVAGTDFGGATADAHCDRRFVTDGGEPSAFCQEVVATLAASQFADDCRSKHMATAGPGLCPREKIIAGCKLDEKHDDKSVATDWYYDVRALSVEAGAEGLVVQPPTPRTVAEVAAVCADPSRYSDGAELVAP